MSNNDLSILETRHDMLLNRVENLVFDLEQLRQRVAILESTIEELEARCVPCDAEMIVL